MISFRLLKIQLQFRCVFIRKFAYFPTIALSPWPPYDSPIKLVHLWISGRNENHVEGNILNVYYFYLELEHSASLWYRTYRVAIYHVPSIFLTLTSFSLHPKMELFVWCVCVHNFSISLKKLPRKKQTNISLGATTHNKEDLKCCSNK